MRASAIIFGSFFLLACAHADDSLPHFALGRDYSVGIHENDAMSRFDLTFENKTNAEMCISEDDWPEHGIVGAGGQVATVIDNGASFEAKYHNLGYCPEGCLIKVPARGALRGYILFSEFDGVDFNKRNANRRLNYQGVPFGCS